MSREMGDEDYLTETSVNSTGPEVRGVEIRSKSTRLITPHQI